MQQLGQALLSLPSKPERIPVMLCLVKMTLLTGSLTSKTILLFATPIPNFWRRSLDEQMKSSKCKLRNSLRMCEGLSKFLEAGIRKLRLWRCKTFRCLEELLASKAWIVMMMKAITTCRAGPSSVALDLIATQICTVTKKHSARRQSA